MPTWLCFRQFNVTSSCGIFASNTDRPCCSTMHSALQYHASHYPWPCEPSLFHIASGRKVTRRGTAQWHTMQCNVQANSLQYDTMYKTTQCNTMQYNAIQCVLTLRNECMWNSRSVKRRFIRYSAQDHTVQYNAIQWNSMCMDAAHVAHGMRQCAEH